MEEDSDFFGNVFDDPDDDPLLSQDGGTSSNPESGEKGPPSWVSEDQEEGIGGTAAHDEGGSGDELSNERKEVVIDQGGSREGLTDFNEALDHGWRLVHLYVVESGAEHVSQRRMPDRFVAILEQDGPQSLFDFAGEE